MRGVQLRVYVILVLLAANMALGWIYITQDRQDAQEAQRKARDLAVVLAQNGIAVPEDFVWPESGAYRLLYRRDEEWEAEAAQALLGPCRQERSDDRVRYSGAPGAVDFRQGGLWEARWQESEDSTMTALAARLGLENIDFLTENTATQAFDGIPVVNAGLTLTQEDGGPTVLSGRWVTGEPLAVIGTWSRSPHTCLLAYIGGPPAFSSIESVDLVYLMEPLTQYLTPAWRFDTDAGILLLDAVSGERRPEL